MTIESWIRSKLGCGYVYGATGWVCSAKRRNQQATQYPEHADNILGICAKWDGKECYDCAQLIRKALESVGVTGVPSGATSQWRKKSLWTESGTIDSLPPDGLVALCRESGNSMQHIGWRLSDGSVIDARSSSKGVIESRVEDYKWTHWMRPVLPNEQPIDKEDIRMPVLYNAIVNTQSDPLRVRKWAITGEIIGKIPKGHTVEVLTEPADGWCQIRYNELEGYVSAQYLAQVAAPTEPEAGGLTIIDDAGNTFKPVGNWRVMVNG